MVNACLANDLESARQYNYKIYDLHKWLYIEGNPVGIKSPMKVLGLYENYVRLPLHMMSDSNYNKLKEAVLKIVADKT